jgi:hypothetical protein
MRELPNSDSELVSCLDDWSLILRESNVNFSCLSVKTRKKLRNKDFALTCYVLGLLNDILSRTHNVASKVRFLSKITNVEL